MLERCGPALNQSQVVLVVVESVLECSNNGSFASSMFLFDFRQCFCRDGTLDDHSFFVGETSCDEIVYKIRFCNLWQIAFSFYSLCCFCCVCFVWSIWWCRSCLPCGSDNCSFEIDWPHWFIYFFTGFGRRFSIACMMLEGIEDWQLASYFFSSPDISLSFQFI